MTDSSRQELAPHEAQGNNLDSERNIRAKILRKYSALVNDVNFDYVDLGLKEANIFVILGIQRMEIRHSNFLAWMFDPNGSHGMGNTFLHRFLRDISLESPKQGQNSLDITDTSPKSAEIRREWNNIDILIILDKYVVCIENKVDSSDHESQLSRYRTVIESQFQKHNAVFVYLSPDGRPPNDKGQHKHYINYSYQEIVKHTDRMLQLYGRSLPSNIKTYLEDYTLNIRRNLMKQDHLNELAKKLYSNHKEVLDFIFEHKPDVISQAKAYFSNKLIEAGFLEGSKSKSFVRFITTELDNLLLKNGDGTGGWSNREQFLFELQFSESNNQLIVLFATVVHPSGEQRIRSILIEAIGSHPKAIASNRRFRVQIKQQFTVLTDITKGVDVNSMNAFFSQEWPRIKDIVSDVSNLILAHSEEIRSIYRSPSLPDNKSVS